MMNKIENIFIIIVLFTILNITSFSKENNVKNFSENVSANFEKLGKIENKQIRKKEIKKYIEKIFDLEWMGNFVLGKNKKNLTEQEKNDFINIFSEYMINNYDNLFLIINKQNYKFLSSENRGDIYFIHSNIKIDDGQETRVDFRIIKKDDGNFFITDLITENISFLSTQRSDVDSRIGTIGFKKFMEELKDKNEKLNKQNN